MKNISTLVLGIVACFITVVLACTLVALFAGDGVADFITPLLGFTGTTLALLATIAKVGDVDSKVQDMKGNVEYLANGGTDAKIRAGIADVVKDEFLKDEDHTVEQLAADRIRRDEGPSH